MGLDDTSLFFDLGVFGFWIWIHYYDLTTTFDNPPGWKGFFSAYYDFDWALGIGIGWNGTDRCMHCVDFWGICSSSLRVNYWFVGWLAFKGRIL